MKKSFKFLKLSRTFQKSNTYTLSALENQTKRNWVQGSQRDVNPGIFTVCETNNRVLDFLSETFYMKANLIDIRAGVSARNNQYFQVKFQDVKSGCIYTGYWLLDWESTQRNLSEIVGKPVNGEAHHLLYSLFQKDEVNVRIFLSRFVKNPYEVKTVFSKAFGTEMIQSIEVQQISEESAEAKAEAEIKKIFSLNQKRK